MLRFTVRNKLKLIVLCVLLCGISLCYFAVNDNNLVISSQGMTPRVEYAQVVTTRMKRVTRPTTTVGPRTTYQPLVEFQFDNTTRYRYLWRIFGMDPKCADYTVGFVKNNTGGWLLSFPRSGNTWTRYLLESATGVFTGSGHGDKVFEMYGFFGECYSVKDGNTIISKSHEPEMLDLHNSTLPVVLLIRNPARSIVSLWNFIKTKHVDLEYKMKASIPESAYDSKGFHAFVSKHLKIWERTNTDALNQAKNLHVVFYEKLRENPLRELRGILRFLKVPTDEDRMYCLSKYTNGTLMGGQRQENPYTKEETTLIYQSLLRVNNLLIMKGYGSLPNYKFYLN